MVKRKNLKQFIIDQLLLKYEKTKNVKYLKEIDKRLAYHSE